MNEQQSVPFTRLASALGTGAEARIMRLACGTYRVMLALGEFIAVSFHDDLAEAIEGCAVDLTRQRRLADTQRDVKALRDEDLVDPYHPELGTRDKAVVGCTQNGDDRDSEACGTGHAPRLSGASTAAAQGELRRQQ